MRTLGSSDKQSKLYGPKYRREDTSREPGIYANSYILLKKKKLISRSVKFKISRTLVSTVATCGAETW